MEKDNLELWNRVEKTNPDHTKKANVKGNKITSIRPQYQIYRATEEFGVYGEKWGFKNISFCYELKEFGLVTFKGQFFFPNGEFPIVNTISIWRDGAKTKIDDEFAKKVETDSLTKALSKLGFNADVFMGRFDDLRYIEDVKEEIKQKEQEEIKQKEQELKDKLLSTEEGKELKSCSSVESLGKAYKSMSEENQKKYAKLVTEFKLELINK